MKSHRSIRRSVLICALVAGFAACRSPDTRNSISRFAPPTGLYTLDTDLGRRRFDIQIDDVGDYQITSDFEIKGQRKYRQAQRGRWKWNQERSEFLLTPDPASGSLDFAFRRLRLDDRKSDTLQWLPLEPDTGGPGTIDYIRFRRENQ
jgi:hypothetical protein